MDIQKIEHVGMAVRSLEKASHFYESILGLPIVGQETLTDMKLRVCKVRVGETVLELLEPMEGETVVSKFLEQRGEGVHHLCFAVDNVQNATQMLVSKGYNPIWPEPRKGAGGKWVNFLQPKETHGVLLELNQDRETPDPS